MSVPNVELNDGTRSPSSASGSSRSTPARPPPPCTRRSRSATGTSTPRRCTATSAASGRRSARPGSARRAVRDQQAQQRLPPARRRAPGVRRDPVRARRRLRRPVPDPLAAPDALRRRLRVDLEDAGGVPGRTGARARSASRTSRWTICERLAAETDTVPAVNQIELHPYLLNEEVRAYGEEHGIATEAWSPIAQGDVLDDAVIAEIADRSAGRRPDRPALAHPARQHRRPEVGHARRGCARTSRSSTSSSRPRTSTGSTGLDRGEAGRTGPHPDRFAYVPS